MYPLEHIIHYTVAAYTVSETVTFRSFVAEVADILSIAPKEVKIVYRFSIQPRNTPFTHLKRETEFEDLFERAQEALAKKQKGKSIQPLFVEIKDLRDKMDQTSIKGKASKAYYYALLRAPILTALMMKLIRLRFRIKKEARHSGHSK